MPELPEVFTVTKDLKENLLQKTIKEIDVEPEYKIRPNKKDFINKVKGKKVINIDRIAKNILIELDGGDCIRVHLAMSGQLRLFKKDTLSEIPKWTRVNILLDTKEHLLFIDMRKFGRFEWIPLENRKKLEKKYGLEPISEKYNIKDFQKTLKKKNTSIKNILMDQNLIAGLGNIYATEALYRSGIDPRKLSYDLNKKEIKKLYQETIAVLKEGISNRGTTLEDKKYVDLQGKEGNNFVNLKIYRKLKCETCGRKVEKVKIGQRNTYFCPNCQK